MLLATMMDSISLGRGHRDASKEEKRKDWGQSNHTLFYHPNLDALDAPDSV